MKLWKNLAPLWSPFWNRKISLYASSACFYMILSLLPAALLILSLLFRFSITEENLLTFLQTILPSGFITIFQYLEKAVPKTPAVAFHFSLFTLLWSASKGALAIAEGLDGKQGSGFLLRRLSGIVYFLFLWTAITVMLIAHVFGQSILNFLFSHTVTISQFWLLLLRLRFLYTIALLSVFFAFVYRIFPEEKAKKSYCLLSGAAVSAAWSLFSWLFSIYVNYISSHHRLYGGIGLLILSVIWLHICIILILQGGVLCKLLESRNYHPIQIIKSAFNNKD